MFDKSKLPDLCMGTVTVITSNNLVITGVISLSADQNSCQGWEVKPDPASVPNYEVKPNPNGYQNYGGKPNPNSTLNYVVKPNPNSQNNEIKPSQDSIHIYGDKPKSGEEFITITLNEPLLVIPGSGTTALVQPFYVSGDTIRINLDQIETIGPAHPST